MEASTKFPDLTTQIKRTIFYISTGGYAARTIVIPKFLKGIAESINAKQARDFLKNYFYVPKPMIPMAKEIICKEILDEPNPDEHRQSYFHPAKYRECAEYMGNRKPFDFSLQLADLRIKTLLWSGKFDPVTPNKSMKKIHRLLKNSILWENEHAGHVLFREKRSCAEAILSAFIANESTLLNQYIESDYCRAPPAMPSGKLL